MPLHVFAIEVWTLVPQFFHFQKHQPRHIFPSHLHLQTGRRRITRHGNEPDLKNVITCIILSPRKNVILCYLGGQKHTIKRTVIRNFVDNARDL